MREGSGLVRFAKEYPERYFDVAIAEQHAVTLAAGLACAGQKPVVAIYSTFLQRAYDQLIHDVALQNLPVLFAIDRAGAVGPDGKTHAGSYDISFLRCIPNMTLMAPANENEMRQMLHTGFQLNGPSAIRYPRVTGPGVAIANKPSPLDIGKAKQTRMGRCIAILSFGTMLEVAEQVAEVIDASVVNMRFIKPLDESMVISIAKQHDIIVTIEDNVVAGGAGSGINQILVRENLSNRILNLGLPDYFQEHGSRDDLLKEAELDKSGVLNQISKIYPLGDCVAEDAHVTS
jgi:1-deoxy-D-xylulose-5-phosphate synthase